MIRSPIATCALCLLVSAPVCADITPQDVWTAWQDLAAQADQTLSAERVETTRDGLILHGLGLRLSASDGSTLSADLGRVTLDGQNGDVVIQWPQSVAFETKSPPGNASEVRGQGQITQSNSSLTAFGTPGQVAYRFDVPEAAVMYTAEDQAANQPARADITAQVSQLIGQAANLFQGTDTPTSAAFTIAQAAWSIDLTANQSSVIGNSTAEDVQIDLRGIPGGENDIGLSMTGTGKAADSLHDYQMRSQKGALAYRIEAGATEAGFDFDNQALVFTTQQQDAAVTLRADPMPIPQAQFTVGTIAAHLEVPGDLAMMPAPYHLLLDMTAVDLSQVLAQLDPAGHIDRTPGEVLLDVSGTTTDTQSDDRDQPGPRFVFHTTEIEDFRLGIGGAALTGYGALEENTAPVPGQTVPQGTLHLALDNGLGLLRSLVQAGLIPQQNIAGLQMMLSMFAQPDGDGDRLVSDLEFGPGARMVINGTQVR